MPSSPRSNGSPCPPRTPRPPSRPWTPRVRRPAGSRARHAESVLTRDTDGADVVGVAFPDRATADGVTVTVRSRDHGRWGSWTEVGLSDSAPDTGTDEAAQAKLATEPVGRRRVRPGPDPGERPQGHRQARPPRGDLRRRRDQRGGRVAGADTRRDGRGRGHEAEHHQPRPVGGRREPAHLLARLRRQGQGRHRPPHGEHQHLLGRPGGRPRARHVRLPRQRQRLVRHRLPVPRRPLRPPLRGPVRRRLQERRRRPGSGLQHAVLRHLLHREPRPRHLGRRRAVVRRADGHRQADRVEGLAERLRPVDLGELHLGGKHEVGRGDGRHQATGLRAPRLQPDHLPRRPDVQQAGDDALHRDLRVHGRGQRGVVRGRRHQRGRDLHPARPAPRSPSPVAASATAAG